MVSAKFKRGLSVEIIGGVSSAIIIALLFFVFSDYVFSPPNINGKWYVVTQIENTSYRPYHKLITVHEVYVYQDREALTGRGEKVKAISTDGRVESYIASNRIHSEINGAIDRNFIKKDILHVHLVENGEQRVSNAYYKLTRFNDSYMTGEFESSVASSNGTAEWVRDLNQLMEILLEK